MGSEAKKRDKARAKLAKKQAKAAVKAGRDGSPPEKATSPAVRYAEYVRGSLYLLMGGSLLVALVLGQRGAIVSLNDLIDSLFAARLGKVLLALIGAGLLIYGLKHLRVVR